MTSKRIALMVSVCVLPMLAFAQEPAAVDYNRPGPYVELNAGINLASIKLLGKTESKVAGGGINVNGGYRFISYLAAEVGYTWYSVGLNELHAAVVPTLPLGPENRFRLFGKLGASYLFTSEDDTLLFFGGLGAGYSLTENIDINLQLQGQSIGFANIGLLSLGAAYRF